MDEIDQRERESRRDSATKYERQREAEESERDRLAEALDEAPPTGQTSKGDQMATTDIWTFREQTWGTTDLTGYSVEATDGSIGKVDEATYEVGSSYIVVDTGPWIFGKKVMLPAGTIQSVDTGEEKIFVNLTKDEIKNAPEFDETRYQDETYRTEIGGYYGRGT